MTHDDCKNNWHRTCLCYNKSIRHGYCKSCDVATVEPACANHGERDNKINHD